MTALHWVAFNGDDLSIRYLLRAAKIYQDATGNEPSHFNKVNHMIRDNQGMFPIDYAGVFDKDEALDEFLASVPTKDKFKKLEKPKTAIKEGEENNSDVELIELDKLVGFDDSDMEENMKDGLIKAPDSSRENIVKKQNASKI
eukprot:CAMPEP_0116881320 /NCGR_PEP_ID=MMETSP0463-20121206/13452_1 /TAXON_ID=181622 /ORGANISM="Strombidinopsis sp, Strain SopsisLIS2011" /LENGTH=142 /DNA_ID=CAMNT_0004533187 /DNA_START=352 /DNA_END=780 /DNA_ORIENTATION=+